MERALGTSSILDWVEDHCSRLATLGLTNDSHIRFTKPLLDRVGIQEIRESTLVDGLAQISPADGGGFRIELLPLRRRPWDQRFWIAHEIAHTFWFRKGSNQIPLSDLQVRYGTDSTIEWLCNRAAAALLIPKFLMEMRKNNSLFQLASGQLHLMASCATNLRVSERLLARRI